MHAISYILLVSLSALASCQTCSIDPSKATLLSSPLALPSRTLTFDNLGYTAFTGWEGGGGTKILTLNSAGDTIKGTVKCVIFRGQWQATAWNGAISWPSETTIPGYFLGIDSGFDTCTFTFSGSVLAIVARVNTYSADEVQPGTMVALDDSNMRLGCTTLTASTGEVNQFTSIGFQSKSKAIKTITLTGGYSVLDNLQIVACPTGYSVQSGECVDDDECALFASDCHYMAECQNTPGSFVCVCPGGMTGTGHGDEGCIYPPVVEPIAPPVAVPTIAPINMPVASPVTSPVTVPTIAPNNIPVASPVGVPTSAPASPPLMEPIASPMTIPTSRPVSEPVHDPTPSPTSEPASSTTPIPVEPTAQPQTVPLNMPVVVPSIDVPVVLQPSTVPIQPHSSGTPAAKGTQPNQAGRLAQSTFLYLLPLGILLYHM
jgi:Calcium-binding EGF domain